MEWGAAYSPKGEVSVSLHSDRALNDRTSDGESIRTIQTRVS